MRIKPSLAQRIIIAFALMSLLVAGAFAIGTVLVVQMLEGRLLSAQLGRDLDRLLMMDSMDEWRSQPRPDQLFHFTDGPDEFELPADLHGLRQGFQEVFRGAHAFHVMVRRVDGREYVLLQDQSDFERRERLMYAVVLVGFLLSVLLAGLLGWLLARRVMAPVARLAEQVRQHDQLLAAAPLAPAYARDEVGALAEAFDAALSQLRGALTREQLFTSDVSHELRTPLMVLAGSCELLLENPALEARARRQVERIARASEEMRELVQTFLQLAREQSPQQAQEAPRASLRTLADELVAHWREPIEAKGLRLEYLPQIEDGRLYNAIFLRAVLGNLLRNAWHYTDSGVIRLRLEAGGFVVEDSGAGIPEAMREAVFQPFVRGRGERGDGLGLGLSLIQRICAHEGWQIALQAVQPHGCRFSVRL